MTITLTPLPSLTNGMACGELCDSRNDLFGIRSTAHSKSRYKIGKVHQTEDYKSAESLRWPEVSSDMFRPLRRGRSTIRNRCRRLEKGIVGIHYPRNSFGGMRILNLTPVIPCVQNTATVVLEINDEYIFLPPSTAVVTTRLIPCVYLRSTI